MLEIEPSPEHGVRDGYVPARDHELFYRDVGRGPAIIVLHGGPDFDHRYLLPELDRLSDGYRLIYYDQRGRGRSRGEVRLEEINVEQCVADLDAVRRFFGLDRVAILGHSWGGHLAMQYALAHPGRLSRMIVMNTAPASHRDYLRMNVETARRRAADRDALDRIESSSAFQDGDPQAVSAYYAVAFRSAFVRPGFAQRLRITFPSREDVLAGRAIEDKLMDALYPAEGFDLLPPLRRLAVHTLVLHGDEDFVPVQCAANIARAIPRAQLAVIERCGHFSYIEAPEEVRGAIDRFFGDA